ncbi:rhs element Vgr family protein, putative [Babesia ovata]|uniref:Rhs element Vgr family protein, putative n=1 Tax=Babesia ovata TaxID=189622 RepID=A0A2H6K7V4_9APIC|nr:rhs element Vgr family protein, putative [Babesia ovata]GBE59076.1 rhs element Vgr family protein, putative [Babesia ovata]
MLDTNGQTGNFSQGSKQKSLQQDPSTAKPELYVSSCKDNVSLELLKLDFLAYHLLVRQPWLVAATKQIPDDGSVSIPDKSEAVTPKRTRRKHVVLTRPDFRARAYIRRYVGKNPAFSLHALGCKGQPVGGTSCLRRCHTHSFLDAYVKSTMRSGGIDKSAYFGIYAFVERRLMRHFGGLVPGVNPTGTCVHVGDSAIEEDMTLKELATYVQDSENMLHVLSRKPGVYVRLLFIALLMLLRNLRRALRRHPPSAMLIEFTILCAEALQFTHEYAHRVCIALYTKLVHRLGPTPCAHTIQLAPPNFPDFIEPDLAASASPEPRVGRSCMYSPYSHHCCSTIRDSTVSRRDEEFKRNRNLLITYREQCTSYKKALIIRGQLAWKGYRDELDCEIANNPIQQQRSDANSGDPQSSARTHDTALPEDSPSCSIFSEFVNVADKLLFQWSIGLCRYASEANRIIQNPLLMEYRSLGFGLPSEGPVKLYKEVHGPNLTMHRFKRLAAIIRGRMPQKSETEECRKEPPKKQAKATPAKIPASNKTSEEVDPALPAKSAAEKAAESEVTRDVSDSSSAGSCSVDLTLHDVVCPADASRLSMFFSPLWRTEQEDGCKSCDPSLVFRRPVSCGMRQSAARAEADNKEDKDAPPTAHTSAEMPSVPRLTSAMDDDWSCFLVNKAVDRTETDFCNVDVAAAEQEQPMASASSSPQKENRRDEPEAESHKSAPTTIEQAEETVVPTETAAPEEISAPEAANLAAKTLPAEEITPAAEISPPAEIAKSGETAAPTEIINPAKTSPVETITTPEEASQPEETTASEGVSQPEETTASEGMSQPEETTASEGVSQHEETTVSEGVSQSDEIITPEEAAPDAETPLPAETSPPEEIATPEESSTPEEVSQPETNPVGITLRNRGLRIQVGSTSASPQLKSATPARRRGKWKRDEVLTLVDAINKHGAGRWAYFATTYFGGRRTGMQLKDKWCNLLRYRHVFQDTSARRTGVSLIPPWRLVDNFE